VLEWQCFVKKTGERILTASNVPVQGRSGLVAPVSSEWFSPQEKNVNEGKPKKHQVSKCENKENCDKKQY